MDLIPKPDQVASAASNVANKVLHGGVADLRPMPRTLIDEGPLRFVYRYDRAEGVDPFGDPVLLVMPLAAPSSCYDLRRSCSLVEHFVNAGRPTYLVEYGEVAFKDRALGFEHWVDEVLPSAIDAVHRDTGRRPVHLVAWSLGGIFSVLTLAAHTDLPVASLTTLGSPWDVAKVPLLAPVRPLLNANIPEPLRVITKGYQVLGGAPSTLVRWGFQLSAVDKLVTKPLVTVQHLDDTDFLAQLEAVAAFTRDMTAYPGRTFGQLYHRVIRNNELRTGRLDLGDRTIDVRDVKVPVLVMGGQTDGIAPLGAVRPIVAMLKSAPAVRWEAVPGGHLGMVTGRAARGTTWPLIDAWLDQWASAGTSRMGIGANPRRRHSSAGSRALKS
ncbi:alpha/beta fold hydrolase [Nocardioides jiangxiensis]|uniref:Alpha/beta hydrolase n=1 Tax=Nocardioides jiangxiensis TaxID=3064524 RepID=A0ABT9AYW2_9ACTN|nr:alpha/beta fold hydrolase [Nocardioides sp. WY-20]MDO7867769.1 alpha/beta hydrolase [Nocardioides sp. WY-20]